VNHAERPARWWTVSVVLFVLAALVFAFSRTWADPDIWGHLRFGQDLWETGHVIRADPYSYLTGDQRWVNHEWMAEAIFSRVFAAAGSSGLVWMKLLLSLLLTAWLYRRLVRQGLDVLPAGLLITSFSLLIVPGLTTVRPQLWSYLLFAVLLFSIDAAERGAAWPLAVVPLLFALWANLHGAFLVGLGMFLLWAAVRLATSWWPTRVGLPSWSARPWLVVASAGATVAATLLTPYGVDLWLSLRSVTDRRLELVEWNPLVLGSLVGVIYLVLLVISAGSMLASRVEKNAAVTVLFAGAAFLPHVAVRHTPFFALTALFVSGEHIGDAFRRWWGGRWSTEVAQGRFRSALAALLIAGVLSLAALSAPYLRCIRVDTDEYPVRAVALLQSSGVSGNMAVFFEWGDYVLWHLGPRVKVSGDTRREMLYSEAAYRANLRLVYGTGDWDTVLRDDTHLALVSKKFPTFNLMALDRDWRLVSEDSISGLFARQGSAVLERLLQVAPSAPVPDEPIRCFP
jgi:hypothetical protein